MENERLDDLITGYAEVYGDGAIFAEAVADLPSVSWDDYRDTNDDYFAEMSDEDLLDFCYPLARRLEREGDAC